MPNEHAETVTLRRQYERLLDRVIEDDQEVVREHSGPYLLGPAFLASCTGRSQWQHAQSAKVAEGARVICQIWEQARRRGRWGCRSAGFLPCCGHTNPTLKRVWSKDLPNGLDQRRRSRAGLSLRTPSAVAIIPSARLPLLRCGERMSDARKLLQLPTTVISASLQRDRNAGCEDRE